MRISAGAATAPIRLVQMWVFAMAVVFWLAILASPLGLDGSPTFIVWGACNRRIFGLALAAQMCQCRA